MKTNRFPKSKSILSFMSNVFFVSMGVLLSLASFGILLVSLFKLFICITTGCDLLMELLNLVSYFIISLAIFDVGRYLIEEEVFRNRELRTPIEARRSLTKFMVIILIAVTLESLLSVIKASTSSLQELVYPSILFTVAILLLVGLGVYQRLSILTEAALEERHK
ncbi:MAG: hypothetical protein S4CHLAM123_12070 [Chlamydiales bacterium]|nr:hypothetical protein [Chlamydiales bacterium]